MEIYTPCRNVMSMESSTKKAILAILLIAPIPSLSLLIGQNSGSGIIGQVTFVLSKCWLLAIPLWWHLKLEGNERSWSPPSKGGWGISAALGAGMAGIILAAWFLLGSVAVDAEEIRATWGVFGLTDWRILLGVCLYWIFLNSVLEEIVFRWFITTRAEILFGNEDMMKPILLSATVFTAHHTVALAFGGIVWWVIILGTVSIFIAGLIFSWIYMKYRSVWVVWLCHAIADVGLFIVIAMIMLG